MKLKKVEDTTQYNGGYPNYFDDRHKRKMLILAPIKPYDYKEQQPDVEVKPILKRKY
jgi:hypothetical protein